MNKKILRVEQVENGWIVIEMTVFDDDEDDEKEKGWSPDHEGQHDHDGCNHSPQKVHVFVDHAKLVAFMTERTRPPKVAKP